MRARKRFGQHFLNDHTVLQRIVAAVDPRDGDSVLEIGPGHGALTEHVVRHVAGRLHYVAVEIDRDLIARLRTRFPAIEFVNEDILRVDLVRVLAGREWRLIGNLPYNISSPLLLRCAEASRDLAEASRDLAEASRDLAEASRDPAEASRDPAEASSHRAVRDMHFLLQREMAERLSAEPGTKAWGRLSVIVQSLCTVEYLFDVAPESFTPPPKVWSGLVRLSPRADAIDRAMQDRLNQVLQKAFSGRRKRLSNSLKAFGIEWDQIDLDPGLRADSVTARQYLELANSGSLGRSEITPGSTAR